MRRSVQVPCMLLALLLFLWTGLSSRAANQLRSYAAAGLMPAWSLAEGFKQYIWDRPMLAGDRAGLKTRGSSLEFGSSDNHLAKLELENRALKSEIEFAGQWLCHDKKLENLDRLLQSEIAQSRRSHLTDLLLRRLQAVPGRVIYRDPSSWASSLWIDVGSDDNQIWGKPVIGQNSPVVDGNTLIGIVDYVGRRQSRVRLITDSGLSPAVRVARGSGWHQDVMDLIAALGERLRGKEELLHLLAKLQEAIGAPTEDVWLAKGELQGCGGSFWRARPVLKGVGFNYNYADQEGPSRDLRTGKPMKGAAASSPLIREGDLLITSGLDGVFPPGLSVAVVSFVAPLPEGGFAYEIEATAAACALHRLQTVFVLPSLSGEE